MNDTFDTLLDDARQNDVKAQRTLLLILNSHYSNKHEFYNDFGKLTDEDVCDWIIPLALLIYVPAVKVVRFGMITERRRFWVETLPDEDSNKLVDVERSEVIADETYFTLDKTLLGLIDGMIDHQTLPTETLHELFFNDERSEVYPYRCLDDSINLRVLRELSSRGDRSANETLGNYYRDGREEVGIFIDYDRAKFYYNLAHCNEDFDPTDFAVECCQSSIESLPDCATFVVEGASTQAVKQLIETLYQQYGEHSEPRYYLPLGIVMKLLVGSDAYVGYIQSLTEHTPEKIEFTAEFYNSFPDCLKCALEQCFPDLNVNFTLTD